MNAEPVESKEVKNPHEDWQYLSYSGWKIYDPSEGGCPYRYKLRYIDEIQAQRDPRTSIFGSAYGKLFEWFYEQQFWAEPDPIVATLNHVNEAIKFTLNDKQYFPEREFIIYLKDEMNKLVPSTVSVIQKHELLDNFSRAEVKLHTTYYNKNYDFSLRMGGYADFIHGREHPWLLDGKAYEERDKYADPGQLIWYATQHYLKFRVAPAKIGFLYYKFPDDPIDWIDYNENDIRRCIKKAYDAASQIRLKVFNKRPSRKCKMCEFQSQCAEGKEFVEAMDIEAKSNIDFDNSIFGIESV